MGTVIVPTYAHVLPLAPQFLRNDGRMQINCTSQAKKISIKARKSLLECHAFHSWGMNGSHMTSVTGVRKDLALFNYARTTEHFSSLAPKMEKQYYKHVGT